MYLAFERIGGQLHYRLRISEQIESGFYSFREIFDLGPDPTLYIQELDENCFIFDERVENAVQEVIDNDASVELERLLYPFLTQQHRNQIDRFGNHRSYTIPPITDEDKKAIAREVHRFDLKRQYYLYYGAVDQRHLHKLHPRLARKLKGMSRDEKEFYFMEQERDLSLRQIKTYVFAIFDLQTHFNQSFAPFMPGALPLDEVEDAFLSELCSLSFDPAFYRGEKKPCWLHPHLRRYVIMFFDYSFEQQSFTQDYLRYFKASHRTFKWPERKPAADERTVQELFGVSVTDLKKMTKRDLAKLYRKRAMQLHPDQGGDHEKFILLTETYTFYVKRTN